MYIIYNIHMYVRMYIIYNIHMYVLYVHNISIQTTNMLTFKAIFTIPVTTDSFVNSMPPNTLILSEKSFCMLVDR